MRPVTVGACADRTADDARRLASARAATLARVNRSSVRSTVLLAALLTAVPALPASTAAARLSAGDARTTQTYLQAAYAAARVEVDSFPTALAAVDKLAANVRAECPGVIAGEPHPAPGASSNPSAQAISEEVLQAILGAAASTEAVRRERFAGFVARLRWSSSALTRLVHENADGEAERATIPGPNLCADMRAWVASGYEVVPAATARYLLLEYHAAVETEGTEATIERKLAAYESPAAARLAHKLARLEETQSHALLRKLLAAAAGVTHALVTPVPASA